MAFSKLARRKKIRMRVRKAVSGTSVRPRLSVFRSNAAIYAQLIDDTAGHTLMSTNSRDLKLKGPKIDQAREVGKAIAKQALEAGITAVGFDRGGFLYHGRIKALAEGAREGGLQF